MNSEQFQALMQRMTSAICRGDGSDASACFVPDGIYHDGFYGEFIGREAIVVMVRDFFHRDAGEFEWRIFDGLSNGRIGYARYEFSYLSKISGAEGRRIGFSGISFCEFKDDLICRYSEVFERAPVLVKLGFSDDRILKSLKRWAGN